MPPATGHNWKWSTGGIIAAVGAVTTLITTIGGLLWTAAGVAYSTQHIPDIERKQQTLLLDVQDLKTAQKYSDSRYTEILTQLRSINDKLDNKQDRRTP